MPRVKRAVHAQKKRRKVLDQAKGYWGLKSTNYKYAKEQVERSLSYAYRDRKVRKREFRKLWIMRINAGARANGLSYNQFIAGLKAADVELDRKVLADLAIVDPEKFAELAEQAKAALAKYDRQAEIFRRQAGYCDGRSPLYADLCRRLADDPRVGAVAPDLDWDFPLRLLAALHYLVLAGEASWDDVDKALETRGDFLRHFTADQDVQTNEVQRAWALLPGFLTLADGRPFDLLELGPSAGLNLVWDRYAYRYSTAAWGAGELELSGDDRVPPPAKLFDRSVAVARRRGIDLNPVDATTDHGARLLQSFVWADQTERLERLRRAIETLRGDPPELLRGDYVESLPALLADRRPGAQLVVFQTASTMYLPDGAVRQLRDAFARAARVEPLVFLTTGRAPDDNGFSLEIERYPGGRAKRLAVFDFHGAWLDWGR